MKSETETACSSRRDENSLFVLTKKFIKLISTSPDNFINTNRAAEVLGVGKRRIYDITNVLEGLGMLSKWSVNSVKWTGSNIDEILSSDISEKYAEDLATAKNQEEIALDKEIDELNREIQELSMNDRNLDNAYVTFEDLYNLKIFKNKLVFAVKAPSDTSMEYPRYQKGSYRLKIMTEKGQISVYYVSNENKAAN